MLPLVGGGYCDQSMCNRLRDVSVVTPITGSDRTCRLGDSAVPTGKDETLPVALGHKPFSEVVRPTKERPTARAGPAPTRNKRDSVVP